MARVRKISAPHGARIRVRKGKRVKVPKKSTITVSTQGGKKMPKRKVKRNRPAAGRPGTRKRAPAGKRAVARKKVTARRAAPAPKWTGRGVVTGRVTVSGQRLPVRVARPGLDIEKEVGFNVRSRKIQSKKAKRSITI